MKPTEYLVKLVTGSEDAGQLLEYMECRDPTKPYQTVGAACTFTQSLNNGAHWVWSNSV